MILWLTPFILLAYAAARGRQAPYTPLLCMLCGLAIAVAATITIRSSVDKLGDARVSLEAVEFGGTGPEVASIGGVAGNDDIVIDGAPPGLISFARSGPDTLTIRVHGDQSWSVQSVLARLCLDIAGCASEAQLAVTRLKFDRPSIVRSFRASLVSAREDGAAAPMRLRLVLDTPQTVELNKADLHEEAWRHGGKITFRLASAVAGSMTAFDPQSRMPSPVVTFPLLGKGFRDELMQSVRFDETESSASEDVFDIDDTNGIKQVPSGHAVQLGTRNQVVVRLTRLDRYWNALGVVYLILLVGAAASLAATFEKRRRDPLVWTLFTLLEFLLTVRILVALEAGYVDKSLGAGLALPQALCAFVICPLAFSFIGPGWRDRPWRKAAHAAFALICLWMLGRNFETVGTAWWAIGILLTALCALAPEPVWSRVSSIAAASGGYAARGASAIWTYLSKFFDAGRIALRPRPAARFRASIALPLAEGASRLSEKLGQWSREIPGWWWASLFGLVALRLALAKGLGFREAIDLGTLRVSLSILYVPAAAFLLGTLFYFRSQSRSDARPLTFAFVLALGLLYGAVSIAVSDNGAAIYALPALLAASLIAPDQSDDARSVWRRSGFVFALSLFGAALAGAAFYFYIRAGLGRELIAIAVVTVIYFCAVFWLRPSAIWPLPALSAAGVIITAVALLHPYSLDVTLDRLAAQPQAESTKISLESFAKVSRDQMRLLQFADPTKLETIGTSNAEELRSAMQHMSTYSGSMWGRGYLNVPPPTELHRFHMNNNVSAVHVLAPVGRVGGFLFLLFEVFCCALATAHMVGAGSGRASVGGAQFGALLCLWTIPLVSVYMFLANVQLVPFTGRNVYFLSVASMGDIIEGFVLLAFAKLFLRGPHA